LLIVTANWQIGKDQKYQDKCRCPAVQPSQEKRPQEHQVTSKTSEDSTTFSSSSSVTDSCGIIPFFTRRPDSASTNSSQSPPQPQETLADVLEQTADPVAPIISSVVSSEQTRTAPPQGKVLPITLSLMDLFSNHNYLYYFSVDIVPSATPAD